MITLLTATLPERAPLFAELAVTVARQSLPPERWLVEWDYNKRGPVDVLNGLSDEVETEWLFRIDDDDLLEWDHFDTLKPYLTKDADIVYSWCEARGPLPANQFQVPFNPNSLRYENYIPSAACIRTDLWRSLGGYRTSEWTKHEDHDFWVRALDAGARFRCVPIVTWTYRLGKWEHRSL